LAHEETPGRPKFPRTPSGGLAKPGLGANDETPGRPKFPRTPSGGLAKPGLGALMKRPFGAQWMLVHKLFCWVGECFVNLQRLALGHAVATSS